MQRQGVDLEGRTARMGDEAAVAGKRAPEAGKHRPLAVGRDDYAGAGAEIVPEIAQAEEQR